MNNQLANKIISHIKSEEFPYNGSEMLFLEKKLRPKGLESLPSISTNWTSEKESFNKKYSGINNDLAQNFGPPSRHSYKAPRKYSEKCSFPDPFNEIDDALTQDQASLPKYSAREEHSIQIKIAAVPTQNDEEFEEHKNSYESYSRLSSNQPEQKVYDLSNFLDPAAKLITVLIENNSDSAEQEEADSEQGVGSPWVKKEFSDLLKSENYDELLAYIRPLKSKELKLTGQQALFTFFNAQRSLAFPIFSYNLLQYLDVHGHSLSKKTLDFFEIYHERHKVIQTLSFTLWAIFEVRVYDSLDSFIYRVGVLEYLPLFNEHLGVRKMLSLLLCLFRDLRRIFESLVLCKISSWRKPQSLNKLEEIDSKEGAPEYAKGKLCELMEDLIVFMKENRWVFLLELSKENLRILDTGFKEAENLLNLCLGEIVQMIERQII